MESKGGIGVTDVLEAAATADAEVAHDDTRNAAGLAPLNPLAASIAGRSERNRISRAMLIGGVMATDAAIIMATGIATYAIYVLPQVGFLPFYPIAFLTAVILAIAAFRIFHLYDIAAMQNFHHQIAPILGGWALVFALLTTIAFFGKVGDEFSRIWFGLWFVTGGLLLVGWRYSLSRQVHGWIRQGRLDRRAVIIGGGQNAADFIGALEQTDDSDITIIGVFDDRGAERSPEIVAGYRKLGTIDELIAFGRQTRIDMLIVTLPMTAEKRVLDLMAKLWVLPVDIRLSAHANRLRFRPRAYSYVGGVPMLDMADKPLTDWGVFAKQVFDRVVSFGLIVALSPVMLATALAVRLDSKGPILFKQKRYGFNNELIEVYKFRSMRADRCDATASKLVTRDDPRVTRVGRFIRKTSLDELPQLFNVLRGDLSLVGPRPHALEAKAENTLYDQVVDGYFARHRVKPGITGWAQVNGWRGETDTREKIERRVEHDLYYIENWSPWFDLYILAVTPISLVSKPDNAY